MIGKFSLLPPSASSIAPEVDALFFFITAVTVFFSLLIAALIVIFMVRYRRRRDDEVPHVEQHGSYALEVVWSVIPFGLTLVMFFWGASIYASMKRPPDDALHVNVVGKQWMWKAQHMEGRREINELHVPVGRPVRLSIASEDVIHSFYVPAFRIKQDAVPGRINSAWFEATKPGEYHLFCAEYCGTIHSGMIGKVVAMEPAAFQQWLAGVAPGEPPVPVSELGRRLFTEKGCQNCHAGKPGALGPSLGGLLGSTVALVDGSKVTADENYLRESILNPHAKVVAGFGPIMPAYQGLLTEENVMQIIAYLKTLPPADGGQH
jgi:cytochrome c oxidase subunit 2